MGTKISALPAATDTIDMELAAIQGGTTKRVSATLLAGAAGAWATTGPTDMLDDGEVTITHDAVTNEKIEIQVGVNTGQTGQTNIDRDFDVADASKFSYSAGDIAFAAGVVGLKGTTDSSFPTANLALSLNDTLVDASAVPATMTSSGIAYSTDVPSGFEGKSLSVDTTAGLYVKCNPRSRSDIGASNWTVAFWHKYTANPGTIRNILDARNANGSSPWVMYDKDDTACWIWDGTAETKIAETGFFSSGWHHYAIVRNGATLKAYKDGVLNKTTTVSAGTWPPNGDNTTVVRLFTNVAEAQPFTGLTRDFVIAPSALWASDFTPPKYTGLVYPTGWLSGDRSTVRTTDDMQFSLSGVAKINSITVTETIPSGVIKWAVSFDDRVTWVTWDGADWVEVDLTTTDKTDWMSAADMNTAFTDWTPTTETTIDFCAAIESDSAASTPTVDLVSINYDEEYRYDPCIIGSYTSAVAEFGVQRVDSTHTKVKNLMGATKKAIINVRVS